MVVSFTQKTVFIISLLGILAVVYLWFLPSTHTKVMSFADDIRACNKLAPNQKFSCYRFEIQRSGMDVATIENKAKVYTTLFSASDQPKYDYGVFGTNCHTFYHALGDFVATNSKVEDLQKTAASVPGLCTNGYVMGYYKRMALKNGYATDLLAAFYKNCPKGAEHQCAHEIGHSLHDKYTGALLKQIDAISAKQYHMVIPFYNYVTQSKVNLDAPFEECKKILPEEELAYCYTGIGHNLFIFSEFAPDGFKTIFRECDAVETQHKDDCERFVVYRIGINMAGPQFLSGKIDDGIKACNDAVALTKPDFKRDCYLGLGGGIGLFIDSEYADLKIDDKNLAPVQKDVSEKLALCNKVEADFVEECYKGLLGTPVKKLYKTINLENDIIDNILPKINSGFEVVG